MKKEKISDDPPTVKPAKVTIPVQIGKSAVEMTYIGTTMSSKERENWWICSG